MPEYAYRAVTADGRTVRGAESAATPAALERALGARGLYPLEVAAAEPRSATRGFGGGRRAEVVEAVRYLATLVDAGFPLDRALDTVARVMRRADVAGALRRVRERVRAGQPLADALAGEPQVFPRFAAGMARAGERGGYLGEALARLAAHLEREEALRAQLASALLYPAVMAGLGGVALFVLVAYVLPRFAALFADVGAALPGSTALLLDVSDWLGRWWLLLLPAALGAAVMASVYLRSEPGQRAADALLLRLPLVGPLRQRLVAARFGRSLATLLGSGLPILAALDIGADALAGTIAAGEVRRASEELRAGGRLAAGLGRGRAFPYMFVQMIALGEEGGRVPDMLERGAAAAEDQLRRGMERLVRLVEPSLIVAFGTLVGFVALSLIQAIYGFRLDGAR